MNRKVIALTTMALVTTIASNAWCADTPQFRGPERDGKFQETGLLKTWPEGGPEHTWTAEGIGQGYASVAVVDGVVYVPGMLDDNEGYLFAIDLNGKELWRQKYSTETLDRQAPGSRGTPTIDGDRIYVMSGLGVLTCMAKADGKQIWQVDVKAVFKGQDTSWGFSESPLVDGDMVFATPGGQDASIVALDKMTGDTIWTSKGLSEASAYCSPIIFTFGDRRVLTTMTAKSVVGLDVKTGETLWTHPHETDYDIHAVTPACSGNVIYYTAGYGSGGGALDVSADGTKVTQKWLDKNLDCQHHGVVLHDGYIYGTGHKNGELMCLELETGKLMWKSDTISQGDVVFAEGMLYVYEGPKKGIVSLVKATSTGCEVSGSFEIPKGKDKHWAHPAIANGLLFIRHGGNLYAYKISSK